MEKIKIFQLFLIMKITDNFNEYFSCANWLSLSNIYIGKNNIILDSIYQITKIKVWNFDKINNKNNFIELLFNKNTAKNNEKHKNIFKINNLWKIIQNYKDHNKIFIHFFFIFILNTHQQILNKQ